MGASLERVNPGEDPKVYSVKFFEFPSMRTAMVMLSGMALLFAGCSPSGPVAGDTNEAASAKILYFYPGQAAVPPGEPSQLCYGVENATSLRLEPALAEVRPLSSKCIWVEAKETTDLTLIAVGEDGKEVQASATVTVRAGAPSSTRDAVPAASAASSKLIETFATTGSKVPPGGVSTICYVISKPATLSLKPEQGELGSDLKKCVIVKPTATTTYTLTATADGKTETASVMVRVE